MPSSVVIALPLTAATGVTHDRISLPSSNTEHAPHWANPQPKRGPCRCSSLCRTYSSGVSRLAVTLCTRPFTLIFSLLAISLPSNRLGLDPSRPRVEGEELTAAARRVWGDDTPAGTPRAEHRSTGEQSPERATAALPS